ncbi:MAG TPA: hypothetical protein VG778_09605 [Blastocatellia bacterium]|nr:hypothetical protein [Blastocatellia bacterium]
MKRLAFRLIALLVFVACFADEGLAGSAAAEGYSSFIVTRIKVITAQKKQEAEAERTEAIEEIKARITIRGNAKSSEAPSLSSNTTSLVDKSSASDLTGIALNFAGLATDSDEPEATSMAATVSAYAFKAAAAGRDPLDPGFYNANRDWRRVSFTLGVDYPEEGVVDVNDRAILFGVKYLPYDKRDASDPSNADAIRDISAGLQVVSREISNISDEVKKLVIDALIRLGKPIPAGATAINTTYFSDAAWPATYDLLSDDDKIAIDKVITDRIEVFVDFSRKALERADDIRNQHQLAFSFMTKQRRGERPDEHVAQAILDLGLARRFSLSLNASFNYVDNKLFEDNRGGRVAADLQIQLNRDNLEGRLPIFLSFAGDGCWMTDVKPLYRAQAKVTIPLWGGIELPLSVSYANRTEFIDEDDIRGKFGFTFDVVRIAQAFGLGILSTR